MNAQENRTGVSYTTQLRRTDITMWAAFILMLLVKAATMGVMSAVEEVTKADIDSVVAVMEANPMAELFLNLKMLGFMIHGIILPGLAMATYYFFKRRVKKGLVDGDSLEFFVQFAFFSLLANIVNDGSILLGKVM